MADFEFQFEWDRPKARASLAKHGVSFELAATIFRDPLALTLADDEHSDGEQRWVTIGQAPVGTHVVVVHAYEQVRPAVAQVRLISARRPTRAERAPRSRHTLVSAVPE